MKDSEKTAKVLFPIEINEVEDKIAVIRGVPVIADADVAALYGVKTKEVNQAVYNNPDKFPSHYMFESRPLRAMQSKEGAARKCGVFVYGRSRRKLAHVRPLGVFR